MFMRCALLIATMILSAISFSEVFAADYEWSSRYSVVPNGPFDPLHPLDNKIASGCFNYSSNNPSPPYQLIRGKTGFIEDVATFESLTKLDFEAAASGRYGAFSGGAKFSMVKEKSLLSDERTVIWSLLLEKLYQPEITGSFLLTNIGEKALSDAENKQDFETFFDRCGRSFLSQTQKGNSVAIVYKFFASSKQQIETPAFPILP